MQIKKLDNFTKGWFIGNFFPTLDPRDDFEIAVKRYRAGDKEDSHVHRVATEYTVILNGTGVTQYVFKALQNLLHIFSLYPF